MRPPSQVTDGIPSGTLSDLDTIRLQQAARAQSWDRIRWGGGAYGFLHGITDLFIQLRDTDGHLRPAVVIQSKQRQTSGTLEQSGHWSRQHP